MRKLSRAQPWTVLGSGLLLAAVTVVVPVALGAAPLESTIFETDLPVLGHVKATSALAFDVGVYLVVLGLVLMVFESFGDEPGVPGVPDQPGEPGEPGETASVRTAEVTAS